jgi:hypothetical protein
MALDIAKMKQKQKMLETKGGDRESRFWKVPDGKSTVRLLPDRDGDPFRILHLHYDINGKTVPCISKNWKEKCPICEFAYAIYKDKSASEQERLLAKKLLAKERYFSRIVVREDGILEPKTWSYSPTVYKDLLALVLNEEYGDITDPKTGFDLVIDYGKVGGKTFAETKVTPKRKESKLADNQQELDRLTSEDFDVYSLYERFSKDDVELMLKEHLDKLEKAALGTDNPDLSEGGDQVRYGSGEVAEASDLDAKLANFLSAKQ